MRTAIITPTFGNEDLTIRCFESIRNHTRNFQIIWIDNGSSPESRKKVHDFLVGNQIPHETIFNNSNLGFIKATNQGISKALENDFDFIFLQNNDTEVFEGWLDRMIEVAISDPKIGLVGPVASPCDSWQSIRHIRKTIKEIAIPEYNNNPKEYSELLKSSNRAKSEEVKQVIAFFSTLIRRETLIDIGLLSEAFGIGLGDDDDFCARAMLKGWKIFIALDVFIFHNHRSTFKKIFTDSQISEMQSRNKRVYLKRKRGNFVKTDPKIADIVIPHHDRHDLLKNCISKLPYDKFNIIIVSGSSFAENCNKGAKLAETDNLFFINDDTVPDLAVMEKMLLSDAEIVGVTQKIPETNSTIYGLGCKLIEGETRLRRYFAMDWASQVIPSGFFFRIKKSAWKELEGFDEVFLNGGEDSDLFLRAIEKNFKIEIVDDPIVHFHKQSKNRLDHEDDNHYFFDIHWTKSRIESLKSVLAEKHSFLVMSDGCITRKINVEMNNDVETKPSNLPFRFMLLNKKYFISKQRKKVFIYYGNIIRYIKNVAKI